ncbi:ATP-binding cassette domain-containing protein [Streptomyces sp. NPDC021093]|uniref:ATP-binding cassette domain-containing protein n=1 Tax=Streptomyces sp. NPDC021093 TaxID=3365112 RepID=UPI0037A531D4
MIQLRSLTKRHQALTAVDSLTCDIRPGAVTGFLGPNGAGKSTTMRMILGLDRPTSGTATVAGRRCADFPDPLREVGALLDAGAVHGGRTARDNLLHLAQSNRIPARRVDEVLGLVGLDAVAGRRLKGFSLGMRQRLGIAGALLGDPSVLVLDEPVNGLDPEGIHWIRHLLRGLAAEGRTVLISSHLMSEVALSADHLVVIGKGRLLADLPMAEFVERSSVGTVRVTTPRPADLSALLDRAGIAHEEVADTPGAFEVHGARAATVGDLAAGAGVALHELRTRRASLEDAYLSMTSNHGEYRALTGRYPTDGA